MKNKLIVAYFLAIGAVGFAQKQELKEATKAIKSGNLEAASQALKSAEGLIEAAADKYKAQYYLLKGQVASATANGALEKIESAANAYNKAMEIEKASGSSKYTPVANEALVKLRQALIENAIKDQNAKDHSAAAKKLYLGFKTNPADTLYLYYAASNAVNAKEYDTALTYYNKLIDLNFTGIQTQYVATNKKTGKEEAFPAKNMRDISVKTGDFINPKTKKTDSKRGEIAKNIVLIYVSQGKNEEAMQAMANAKKENPNDASLMQAEADMYYKLGDVAKYKSIMEEIVKNDPENPDLFYNLGVSASRLGDNDKAVEYYKKAIDLKPGYEAAQVNVAAVILGKEKKIVDEMNGLGTSSKDYKRYEVLKKQREDVYREAVPYLEGALKANPDNVEALRTLMNIFYQLDDPKADELKTKLKALEGGN
ncbi:tetratricopeptide repeat protein [Aquimarina hainanensis]|uniref:Tetratricopeptide repeat protein n=1 Tax=Aquimarina hainanensis TaxID=1578017 RepID=A0ABW5NEF1_9FLAO|nr:tetratricopeptide repeat protein [Aquimarina sp. TRL1]QKX07192.1 tetratricopeptide repeat protein [Aquimarina sp. TRL1]